MRARHVPLCAADSGAAPPTKLPAVGSAIELCGRWIPRVRARARDREPGRRLRAPILRSHGVVRWTSLASARSAIEWTEATWNPVTGCSKVSPGCRALLAARELPNLSLEDALQLGHLYAERGSLKYEKAALRWLERYLAEGSPRLSHFARVATELAGRERDA